MSQLPRYDRFQTYDWNYEHAPPPVSDDPPEMPGSWTFCGLKVGSPLGVPAGPLLNGRWCLYYASLGFDVVTYKTVRRVEHACYPVPNLLPVRCESLYGGERDLSATESMTGSWAVSFGMPSKSPDVWRRDVEWTREQLPDHQLLVVSVVGTVEPGWSIRELAADYAQCAKWAVAAGADCIETNFSCPNVTTCDGQLYQQPADAAIVAECVRGAVGNVPYLAKIGRLEDEASAEELVDALAPFTTALAMTNSIASTVRDAAGQAAFDGQPRGICGAATLAASVDQTRLVSNLINGKRLPMRLIGVGGVASAADVAQYLDAGAESVQLATAAMIDPQVALRIRRSWPS